MWSVELTVKHLNNFNKVYVQSSTKVSARSLNGCFHSKLETEFYIDYENCFIYVKKYQRVQFI